MEETIRIRTDIQSDGYAGEKFVNINLEQKFDFLEILSLRISQEDAYRKFCSDYGVVVGRVQANEGFGVPNANISVFIPISDIDTENDILYGLYPYQTLQDKNSDGVRYNLLPKKRQNGCHFPVGSFPNKREFLDNDILLEIHDKYYKFTTTTNHAGDYMLFGIPLGNHTIHVDVDISDIGVATRRPYDMIREGNPENMFDTPTKYKHDRDLDQLRQIVKGEMSVDVIPFWGDTTMCGIGINRVDYNLPVYIQTTSMFIGSVITDEDKNSINRHCAARKKTGELNEMRAGQGQIEMIRKTLTDQIEYKMIDGGRVIDDDGTWAYQIPMNLHPMVTDEFGNLVPSEDPRKGLMTQADVRFRVKMDITGGEGRLRETAEYLVPHNPDDASGVDYDFGSATNDDSFYKMRFNKIYTVRNYIPRFQGSMIRWADNRKFTGIKDVDGGGDKENFPYNRLETNLNPIFSIIMVILWIVGAIAYMINAMLIPIINVFITVINWILWIVALIVKAFVYSYCGFISAWNYVFPIHIAGNDYVNIGINTPEICEDPSTIELGVDPIGCLMLTCDQSSGTGSDCDGNPAQEVWAPGCECCGSCGGIGATQHCNDCSEGNNGGCLLNMQGSHPVFHSSGGEDAINADLNEYITCVAAGLASSFDMFKFDFYNDWVNGVLYHILYKNKKTASRREFCDIDYDQSTSLFGGLFSLESYLVDTLVDTHGPLSPTTGTFIPMPSNVEKSWENVSLSRGIIKNYDDHMYYAPFLSGNKLYATDITNLGSSLRCDEDGFPYIIDRIPSTTFNMPPLYDTTMIVCDTSGTESVIVTESGIIGFSEEPGLFMNVNILGLHTNYCQGRNIKLISELGRNTDELTTPPPISGTMPQNPNGVIGMLDGYTTYNLAASVVPCHLNGTLPEMLFSGNTESAESQDIFDEYARFALRGCNYNTAVQDPIFNNTYAGTMYDGSGSYLPHMVFRGFNTDSYGGGDAEFYNEIVDGLPNNNSYYFYFGLIPGKSAMDKLKTRYLTDCSYQEEADFLMRGVITDNTVISGVTGAIEVTILGGVAPYSYLFTRPDGVEIYVDEEYNDILTFNNLTSGVYVLIVNDSTGGSSRGVYEVKEPFPIVAGVQILHPQAAGTATGEIYITSLINGTPITAPTYVITVTGPGGYSNAQTSPPTPLPVAFTDLVEGDYHILVENNGQSVEYDVVLVDPPPFTVFVTGTNILCHNQTGSISFQTSGGTPTIGVTISATSGPNIGFISHAFFNGGLSGGTYEISAIDGAGQLPTQIILNGTSYDPITETVEYTMVNPSELVISVDSNLIVLLRVFANTSLVTLTVEGGTSPTTLTENGIIIGSPSTTPFSFSEYRGVGTYFYKAVDDHGCETQESVQINEPPPLWGSHTITEPQCYTGATGSIFVTPSGGIPESSGAFDSIKITSQPAYRIGLYSGTTLIDTNITTYAGGYSSPPLVGFDDLTRGDYIVYIWDYYSGSMNPTPHPIMVTLTSPDPLTLERTFYNSSSIIVSSNGGTTPHDYFIYLAGVWQTSSLGNEFIGLTSSTSYDFKVVDNHGCVTYKTYSTSS